MQWAAIVLTLLISPFTSANIITFEYRSNDVVAGRIDNKNFNATFVIMATGDTDDREQTNVGWYVHNISASIDIEGVGVFDFITPTSIAVNNSSERTGFGALDVNRALFTGPSHPDFAVWDMTTSIGPITGGDGHLLQWDYENIPVETSGGTLFFEEIEGVNVTFTATVIPSPCTLAVIGYALLIRRRRR